MISVWFILTLIYIRWCVLHAKTNCFSNNKVVFNWDAYNKSRLKYCQLYNWKPIFTYRMDIFWPSVIYKGVHKIGVKQSGIVGVAVWDWVWKVKIQINGRPNSYTFLTWQSHRLNCFFRCWTNAVVIIT